MSYQVVVIKTYRVHNPIRTMDGRCSECGHDGKLIQAVLVSVNKRNPAKRRYGAGAEDCWICIENCAPLAVL